MSGGAPKGDHAEVRETQEANERHSRPRRILGLDLGTITGWCRLLLDSDLDCVYGTWRLKGTGVVRVLAFRDELVRALAGAGGVRPDLVCYEKVQFVVSLSQISVWTQLETVLLMECAEQGIPVLPVPPGTLKKYATGNGRASKADMIASAREVMGAKKLTDNEADAIHLARYGRDAA